MSLLGKIKFLSLRKKVLKKHSEYLKNGNYVGDSRAKSFCLASNERAINFCKNNLKRKYKKDLIGRVLLNKKIRSKNKLFSGELIVLGNSTVNDMPSSVKIFDFSKSAVLTVYHDDNKFNLDHNARLQFEKELPLVPLIQVDTERKFIEEEMIFSKPISSLEGKEYEKIFNKIMGCYQNYFNSNATEKAVSVGDMISDSKDGGLDSKLESALLSSLIKISDQKIPVRRLHGDFTFDNILIKENEIYFIDFEHFGDYVFFYDVFWLMQNEYVYAKNKTLLSGYFAGKFDKEFDKLFKSVNLTFNPELREQYYCIFVLETFNKRIRYIKEKQQVFDYQLDIINTHRAGNNNE